MTPEAPVPDPLLGSAKLSQHQERFMDAITQHPPSKGHRWEMRFGRKRTVWFCARCDVPVAREPVQLTILEWLRWKWSEVKRGRR